MNSYIVIAAFQEYNDGTPQVPKHSLENQLNLDWTALPLSPPPHLLSGLAGSSIPQKNETKFSVLELIPTKREIFLGDQKPLFLPNLYKKQASYVHFIPLVTETKSYMKVRFQDVQLQNLRDIPGVIPRMEILKFKGGWIYSK